jgi:hypothetical protein
MLMSVSASHRDAARGCERPARERLQDELTVRLLVPICWLISSGAWWGRAENGFSMRYVQAMR